MKLYSLLLYPGNKLVEVAGGDRWAASGRADDSGAAVAHIAFSALAKYYIVVLACLGGNKQGFFNFPVSIIGTQKKYTTTGLGPRKNREMAGVDDLVVYIQTAVFYNSLHIHHQIVHTSHFPIFSRTQSGGGVYLWGPNIRSNSHRSAFALWPNTPVFSSGSWSPAC